MANGVGLSESMVGAPVSLQGSYRYRAGMGMIPSAEWDVFMDDFHSFVVATAITNGPGANTPWGWQGAVIDTGATVSVSTSADLAATGALVLSDSSASEGAAFYGTPSVQLVAGKKFFMETRVYSGRVSDNVIQFGLSDGSALTNPEDLWTTASANVVAFGILANDATVKMLADKSNSGSTAETGDVDLTANAWQVLAIYWDGYNLYGFVNGKQAIKWSQTVASTVPTSTALVPFFGHQNGSAGGWNVLVDYIRWSSQR